MFMITIHGLSTIHQKSVVHPPYNTFMILTDHLGLHIEQPRKMEMLFDQLKGWHFILDEAFDVEEQTILVLVQIVEANGTLQPTLDSRKSNGADGAVVVATSRWQGMMVFLLIVVLLSHLLLGCLLPPESVKNLRM
jgi:hypothetical protein